MRRGSSTPAHALRRLTLGNRAFANLVDVRGRGTRGVRLVLLDPRDVRRAKAGLAPVQRPFAAILGCSDARVPVEMVFQQRSNDLFVVRVAGNGVASECLGSLRYAVQNFTASLRLIVVLGHAQCGAVSAAVDSFLRPRNYLALATDYALRAIVDAILVAVRSAALALEGVHGDRVVDEPGYRAALIEVSVVLNAALGAFALRQEFAGRNLQVVFGSYDLATRQVRLPLNPPGRGRREAGLSAAPTDEKMFRELALKLAGSASMRGLLAGHS